MRGCLSGIVRQMWDVDVSDDEAKQLISEYSAMGHSAVSNGLSPESFQKLVQDFTAQLGQPAAPISNSNAMKTSDLAEAESTVVHGTPSIPDTAEMPPDSAQAEPTQPQPVQELALNCGPGHTSVTENANASLLSTDEFETQDAIEQDAQILLAFYKVHEPAYANRKKTEKVLRAYQRKARKQAGATGDACDWRELMYSAIAAQRGYDPRQFQSKTSVHDPRKTRAKRCKRLAPSRVRQKRRVLRALP